MGQDVDVAECVRSCQTSSAPRRPARAPPSTGFDTIQNHVDLLSGKVHPVLTRSTATATDAAVIIRDMCLRSGAGFPDALVVDHDAKFTSDVFRAFLKS